MAHQKVLATSDALLKSVLKSLISNNSKCVQGQVSPQKLPSDQTGCDECSCVMLVC